MSERWNGTSKQRTHSALDSRRTNTFFRSCLLDCSALTMILQDNIGYFSWRNYPSILGIPPERLNRYIWNTVWKQWDAYSKVILQMLHCFLLKRNKRANFKSLFQLAFKLLFCVWDKYFISGPYACFVWIRFVFFPVNFTNSHKSSNGRLVFSGQEKCICGGRLHAARDP